MPGLTVTIDDAGLAPGINEAIARCIEAGSADRISIIATGPLFDDLFGIQGLTDLNISAHLNCIEPPFLTDAVFPGTFMGWVLHSGKYAAAVKEEWKTQIERLLDKNISLSGLDSHRHIHHLPGLRNVILELAEEYGIEYVRTAVLPDRYAGLSALILNAYGQRFRRLAIQKDMKTPEFMLGFSRSGNVTKEYLMRYESAVSGADGIEIVMHPSVRPEWSKGQPEELELLCSEWFSEWREMMKR